MRYHVLFLKSRQVQVKSNHNTVQLAQLTCEVGWNQTRSTTRILVGNLCNPCIFPTNEIQPLSHFTFKDTCIIYSVYAQLSIYSDKVKDDGVPTKIDFDSEEILEVLMTGAQ